MKRTQWQQIIGIDISATTFAATHGPAPQQQTTQTDWPQTPAGFADAAAWWHAAGGTPADTLVCMEATGVYSERLATWLQTQGYTVVCEHPLQVKRAFQLGRDKTDAVDSQQIHAYACRFVDRLRAWQPRAAVVEALRTLLTVRQQLVTHRGTWAHLRHTFAHKVAPCPDARAWAQTQQAALRDAIQRVEQQIHAVVAQAPALAHRVDLVRTIPGVGPILAWHLCVVTEGFTQRCTARTLTAYCGMAPRAHASGTSVYRRPRCPHTGPAVIRRLLFLATCTLRSHRSLFDTYFVRKRAEGKAPRLILHNMAVKLLRIVCAVVQSGTPFLPDYQSVRPPAP